MKRCPRCNQTYTDDGLNFCLNDGELLAFTDEPPPTIFGDRPPEHEGETPTVLLDRARVTNQTNWPNAAPPVPWQPASPGVQSSGYVAAFPRSGDQTLPTISLILGVASV